MIADVHLGYEWSRGRAGDMVPRHGLQETLAKLERLLARNRIARLVVAGDLTESDRPRGPINAEVAALRDWLEHRGVHLVRLGGNHDPTAGPQRLDIADWTIAHGHCILDTRCLVIGHFHPVLKAAGMVLPCFLTNANLIVLPAFSPNAAGWNVSAGSWPEGLRNRDLRCVAALENGLLDFGPIAPLSGRLRAAGG